MPRNPGKCVFCDEGGLTKSHIWPQWSQKVVPPVASTYELTIGGPMLTFEHSVPGPPFQSKLKPGSLVKRQPRNTCANCNGGWMREIEEAAKPAVTNLMMGRRSLLGVLDQLWLATFLCLCSVRLEVSGEMRAIPRSDLDWLRYKRLPPRNWWISICHYQEPVEPEDYYFAYLGMRRSEISDPVPAGPQNCNMQVSTFIAGNLCAHVFSSTVWKDFQGYEEAQLTQVWPIVTPWIDTNYMRYIDNAGLPWLHEAVARNGTPIAS